MFETVRSCYFKDMIDEETGLTNAVKFKWITEEQKQELIESKKAMKRKEEAQQDKNHEQ